MKQRDGNFAGSGHRRLNMAKHLSLRHFVTTIALILATLLLTGCCWHGNWCSPCGSPHHHHCH